MGSDRDRVHEALHAGFAPQFAAIGSCCMLRRLIECNSIKRAYGFGSTYGITAMSDRCL